MEAAGVPVIPGSKEPVCEVHTGLLLAREIGYPVIIKAALGGGGKGMRVAYSEEEFTQSFQTAQKESQMHLAMIPCILNILWRSRDISNFRFWQIPMEM